MGLQTGKEIEILWQDVLDQYEKQSTLTDNVTVESLSGSDMQNNNDTFHRPAQQHVGITSGWDTTGEYDDIIELTVPARMGDPKNATKSLRIDQLRNDSAMKNWTRQAVNQVVTNRNQRIANVVKNTGSQYFTHTLSSGSGYDAIKEVSTILKERQIYIDDGICVFLNNRDAQRISSDLANRSNMNGMPDEAYKSGLIAKNIAGCDVYESSSIPKITGGADPVGITVNGSVDFAPVAFTLAADGETKLPFDSRESGNITLSNATNYNVGDWIEFAGVNSVGLADKTETSSSFVCKIVSKDGNNIKVYPRPIWANSTSLDTNQKAYGNIASQIANLTAVNRLNTSTSLDGNVFWTRDSIEVITSDLPVEQFAKFDGMQIKTEKMSDGTFLYMAYQGTIEGLNLKCRVFTWDGIVNLKPTANGMFAIV